LQRHGGVALGLAQQSLAVVDLGPLQQPEQAARLEAVVGVGPDAPRIVEVEVGRRARIGEQTANDRGLKCVAGRQIADTYNGFQSGSLLWLLERAKINDSQALLRQAERYATMALQWLVTAGAVATVAAAALYLSAGVIGLTIVVTEPSGTTSSFQYAYLYSGG
jgi:phage gp46-like protein